MTENSKVYICYWDCNGFECIVDMTKWGNQSLLDTIAGKELSPPPVNLKILTMRAKFNPQRNPEIWTFNTSHDITEESLWNYAEENPQALVDLIRDKGKRIYGYDRKEPVIK